MIRVLHVTRDFPPHHRGGISTAVEGLARAQVRAGLAVGVLSFDDWRPRAGGGPPAASPAAVGQAGGAVLRVSNAAQLAAARAFACAQRPALLHVHDGMLWRFAECLREELRVPAVITIHVVQRHLNRLRGTCERTLSLDGQEAALATADRVLVPSRAAAAALLDGTAATDNGRPATTLPAARVRVVGHGVEDTPAARAATARHLAAPGSGPLLTAGRFGDVKGTPELFTAMRAVLAHLPDAAWVVAGGIPANRRGEARWRRRWQQSAPTAEQRRVSWTGWLAADALVERYCDAAALIVPSRHESFGLVALEAMLHGLPVAATAGGGLAELIGHDHTGLLSPVGDATALAEHAIALLTDASLARRISAAAASAVRASHLWPQVLPRWLAVYRELL